ncbi:MAG TPA: guanylate kinase [Gemmatimonadaceae bacterium]|nr:guanylate kinase [Gemmatimonadaceae bacterium]
MNPFPLILSAPSGGGKTTIARMLLESRPDIGYSVSCTTRPPRDGEVDGRDYHFLSQNDFEVRRTRGEFAESAVVHGNMYGTLRSEVERVLAAGRHVVMDIDVQGARQFAGVYPESVLVFLLPPSVETLLQRLRDRRTEEDHEFIRRIRSAREELRAAVSYQYIVVNDNVRQACAQVSAIVDAEGVRHARLTDLSRRVAALVEELDSRILSSSLSHL